MIIVKYNGAPYDCGCDYLVDVGYHNGIINMRTYSKERKPMKINGKEFATADEAMGVVAIIHVQFLKEHDEYEFTNLGAM